MTMDGKVEISRPWWSARAARRRAEAERDVESWAPRIRGFLRRLAGPSAPAEDLAQEAIARALEALPHRRGGSRLETWVFGIAVNVCREYRRREGRDEPVDDSMLLSIPDSRSDPARLVTANERRAAVERALATLSPAHRDVLLLRDGAGMGYREIAQALGIPVGTVRSRIHNATALVLRAVEAELR